MEVYNEPPFSKETNLEEILSYSSTSSSFFKMYHEWYNNSIGEYSSDTEKEEARNQLNAYKGLYLIYSILPIYKYMQALKVKFFPSEIVQSIMEKARELGYICSTSEVFGALENAPLNVSRLVLSNVDNANVLIAFEERNPKAFLMALGETKSSIKDLLLFCGFVCHFEPFGNLEITNYDVLRQMCALLDIDNPFSKAAFTDDDDFDNLEAFSVDIAKDIFCKTVIHVIEFKEFIPSDHLSTIDKLLDENLYRDELLSNIININNQECPSTTIIAKDENSDIRPLPPIALQNRPVLRKRTLICPMCQYLQGLFEGANTKDILFVFFGEGDRPTKSLKLKADKSELSNAISFIVGGKNINKETWMFFGYYINGKDGKPVIPTDPNHDSWISNRPVGWAKKKKEYPNKIKKYLESQLRRELTKEEEEDLK